MINSPMRRVSPFLFEGLPQLTAGEVAFERNLARAREVFSGGGDLLASLVEPVAQMLKLEIQAKIASLETVSLENLVVGLPECSLIAQFRLDARGGRSLLVFDTALAQLLINAVLSGGRAVPDESGIDILRPLSPLSEGVLQYVVVTALERLGPALGGKGVFPAFEDVLREPARLKSVFPNGERFLVVTVSLSTCRRDYLVRAVLPFPLIETLAARLDGGKEWDERMTAFRDFKTEFQVEIGQVEVSEDELKQLAPGDIVIFDESEIRLESGRLTGGQGMLKPCEGEGEGFSVDLEFAGGGLNARIKSLA